MAKAPIKKAAKPGLSDAVAKMSAGPKAALFIFSIAVICGGFYSVLYLPYASEATALENELESLKNSLETESDSLNKHNVVAKLSPPTTSAYTYMQQFLPKENEMPDLVQRVSNIAAQAGLNNGVTLFAPQLPAVIKDNYAEIPFTLNLQGQFKAVINFLYDFSQMDRIVNITQVTIGSPKLIGETMEVTVQCSGSTYRILTDAEVATQIK